LHERPLKFTYEGGWLEVEEVTAAWQEPGRLFFRVRTALGMFMLRYHLTREAWEARLLGEQIKGF
jgi:hypothetical protein